MFSGTLRPPALVTCNVEIGSISAVGRLSFEVAVIRCHLINTTLQRGDW